MTRTGFSRRIVTVLLAGLAVLVTACSVGPVGPNSRSAWDVVPGLAGVVAVDAAGNHSLALTGDGRVLAWGDNQGGLGGPAPGEDCAARTPESTTPCRPTPAVVPLPGPAVAVASADDHQAALTADGSVWTWGSDHDPVGPVPGETCPGPFGGLDRCHLTPVRVAGLPPVVAIATGLAHVAAIDRDGRVWQWGEVPAPLATATCSGEPSYGRDYGCSPAPVVVPGLPPVTAVFAHGSTDTLALDADGGVWGWSGARPRPAPGTTATPSRVEVPVAVEGVARGRDGTVLVGRDGSVWVTGRLDGLAPGDCGPKCTLTPVRELPAGSATTVTGPAGLRIRTVEGQVLVRAREGLTASSDPTPTGWTPAPDLARAVSVAHGDAHQLVLLPDGQVLARGYNAWGQLGL